MSSRCSGWGELSHEPFPAFICIVKEKETIEISEKLVAA